MKSVGEIEQPDKTAVSIITPPKVTMNVLKDAKEKGVQSVWLQPGTFNEEVRFLSPIRVEESGRIVG